MVDFQADDQFNQEDVDTIVKNAITSCLTDVMYNQEKVNSWINTIVDTCLKELQSLNRTFKYIVTCIIMQKNGAGMNTAASMFWDSTKDGKTVLTWSNKTMHVLVTVYGIAVNVENPSELD
jgi:dynein light chain Tctex-type 1